MGEGRNRGQGRRSVHVHVACKEGGEVGGEAGEGREGAKGAGVPSAATPPHPLPSNSHQQCSVQTLGIAHSQPPAIRCCPLPLPEIAPTINNTSHHTHSRPFMTMALTSSALFRLTVLLTPSSFPSVDAPPPTCLQPDITTDACHLRTAFFLNSTPKGVVLSF